MKTLRLDEWTFGDRLLTHNQDAPCCLFSRNFWSLTNCACIIVWTAWYQKDVVLQCLLLSISLDVYCQRTSTSLGSLYYCFVPTCRGTQMVLDTITFC